MNIKIVEPTSKGQITLPKTWRDQVNTAHMLMEIGKEYILIRPYHIEQTEKRTVTTDALEEMQKNLLKKPIHVTRPSWDIF